MLLCLLTALAAAGAQPSAPERARAEQLAQSGRPAEAIKLFEEIVEQNPRDIEARLWIARLALRMGRTSDAEVGFRSVIGEHPSDVDARIGLGNVLTQSGEWPEALAILQDAERDAGENSDLFGALGRAYRRAGDHERALEYFRRAKALAPTDQDVVSGFEATALSYGHLVAFDGFGEHASNGVDTGSGALLVRVRATPRLHVEGNVRVQQRTGSSDAIGGGGVVWQVGRAINLGFHAGGGPHNTTLPTSDVYADVMRYAGPFEAGGAFRRLSFGSNDVMAASPLLSWDSGGRWRIDSRYTYSRSSFASTGETSGDHSVMLRETYRGWRRATLDIVYAYGIESFEDLTVDRIGALGSTTLAAGVRISVPSLTILSTAWKHEWRSNNTAVDRITVSVTQSFP
jgi:YaiO family outer membrane protein